MNDIENKIKQLVKFAASQFGLELVDNDIVIENSKSPEHGDLATNVALKFSSRLGKNPRQFATELVDLIKDESISKIEIAGPGFINFFLNKESINSVISEVISAGDNYGKAPRNGKKVNVEFVSANPTGDLHVGHARCAAVGDSICRIYDAAGYDVTREYYINDAGNQIAMLTESVFARYQNAIGNTSYPFPEEGYRGKDIIKLAEIIAKEHGNEYAEKTEENLAKIKDISVYYMLEQIKKDLANFRVVFDVFTSECKIRENHNVEKVLESYKDYSYKQDGAVYLRTTDFLDDKDRPVVKSTGEFTYVMPDIAYHLNKLTRGFDLLVDLLGADHHGYINRMKSALMMKGYSKDVLEIELVQVVRLIKDGQEVKMSKRTGAGVSLRELCDEVGVDASRYFFVSRSQSAHLDFDMDLALEQSSSNPVYYAQYAHARLSHIFEICKDVECDLSGKNLKESQEIALIKCLSEFPKVIQTSSNRREPHLVTTYIQKLAGLIHSFYTECRVIDYDNLEVTKSRLALAKASKIVMKNALNVIGVSAPDHM